jgi:hypothetical protein
MYTVTFKYCYACTQEIAALDEFSGFSYNGTASAALLDQQRSSETAPGGSSKGRSSSSSRSTSPMRDSSGGSSSPAPLSYSNGSSLASTPTALDGLHIAQASPAAAAYSPSGGGCGALSGGIAAHDSRFNFCDPAAAMGPGRSPPTAAPVGGSPMRQSYLDDEDDAHMPLSAAASAPPMPLSPGGRRAALDDSVISPGGSRRKA